MTMNVNWTRVFVVFSVCSVLSITGFSGNAASGNMMVRGILQHVVGIGGETTGLAILLDAPTEVDRESLNQLEIEGDNATLDKLLDKYVQASGTIVYHTGVERGKWPVLKVNDVKEVRPDGKAEWNLGQSMVSLSLEPADIVWKNIAGKSSGVQPKLTFSITNNSRSDLVFKFKS